ncbi:RpiB/LacA/LacB family sugar-phosphate isomerase [Tissierella sp. Yu-01]|uniref:RpiB/LacA/LacB family sugar-phosphate isomerase n=1 Tax=Tissierella sp. Yu-01 TaxID=3035694 RepID=UPI00240D3E19|nr:RpiB/LacA/LacB family sugar-phosphate isomerase [Tissierella sp. Yu-01]WFA10135.1 RpiB/LacA/LacB family sugar-phosphate isomerase [Tissierella sp. Yu-01]
MKIAVVCDKAGYSLKAAMVEKLIEAGYEIIDFGLNNPDDDMDFPDAAQMLCQPVLTGEAERAIMFAGTGVGASIACNKIPGIRASIIHDIQCAHQAVEHDHVQVMCIGGQVVGEWLAWDLIQAFLPAKGFTDEKTLRCVHKLNLMDGSAK